MTRYSGDIGFAVSSVHDGIVEETTTVRHYKGDVTRNSRSFIAAEGVNDNFRITNTISVLMDPYIGENLAAIRWVSFAGSKWKVSSIDVNYPRVNLVLGGVYNGT